MRNFNSFKALSSGIRQDIIEFLGVKERYLSEIAEHVSKTPQTIDFHLNILIDSGFVKAIEKDGKKYYMLTNENILEMIQTKKGHGLIGHHRHHHPIPPHELILNEIEKINKRFDSIEKKLDKVLNKK
jgi:DNA-binding transcriptional ArsR family regulator